MRKRLAAAVLAVSALVAGGAAGSHARGSAATPPVPLHLTSYWRQATGAHAGLRIWTGSTNDAKPRGVVVVAGGGATDVLQVDDRALRLTQPPSGDDWHATLRADSGAVYDLVFGPFGVSLSPLGRKLDPAGLPRLPRAGVAFQIEYGPPGRDAVVLARFDSTRTPHIYGFLDGWRVAGARRADEQMPLSAPPLLRSPAGALYRVGASGLTPAPDATPAHSFLAGHETHPQCHVAKAELRCAGMKTLPLVTPANSADWTISSAARSPDGQTLLLQGTAGCDMSARTAYFLPYDGGRPLPVASGPGIAGSTALGWLGDGDALVAVESSQDCGSEPSGLYVVPPGADPRLVVSTPSRALVVWGKGV